MNSDTTISLTISPTSMNGEKKAYQTPRLQSYGQVQTLTQGGGSIPNADGQSGMAMP